MNAELIDRMGEFVCGYRLREEDAAVIRAAIAALSATPQAEPDTDSADFKEGFAVGRAEAESLAASIKHPACAQCGATCAKDAAAKCRPSGDSCPGVEWPLADLWALQQPATPQADRKAIKLLVAAGFVTEEKANEALNIAHGFQPGPLAATPQAAQVPDDAMVERALKSLCFEDDGAAFPDAYSDDEAEYERAKMRRVLAAAMKVTP